MLFPIAIGPVQLTVFFFLAGIAGGAGMYYYTKQLGDVKWRWVAGIAILFSVGIIPGIIGVWLYFNFARDRRAETAAAG